MLDVDSHISVLPGFNDPYMDQNISTYSTSILSGVGSFLYH